MRIARRAQPLLLLLALTAFIACTDTGMPAPPAGASSTPIDGQRSDTAAPRATNQPEASAARADADASSADASAPNAVADADADASENRTLSIDDVPTSEQNLETLGRMPSVFGGLGGAGSVDCVFDDDPFATCQ
ncbi:MAG: hypothetical protein AAF772_06545 [Acidobacteriota bacterium]